MFGIMIFYWKFFYVFISPVKSSCFQTFISSLKSNIEIEPAPSTLDLEAAQLLVNAQQTLEELNLQLWSCLSPSQASLLPNCSTSLESLPGPHDFCLSRLLFSPTFSRLNFPLTWCSDVPHAYSSFVFTFCSFTKQNVKWSMLSLAQFSLGFFPP